MATEELRGSAVAQAIVFFNISPNWLRLESRFAEAVRTELGLASVVMVHGRDQASAARRLGFDEVWDLSISRRIRTVGKDFRELEASFQDFDLHSPERSLYEDILEDRWIKGRFSIEWTLTYLEHVREKVANVLGRWNVVAGIGETMYAAFRVARRMLLRTGIPYLTHCSNRLGTGFYLEPTLLGEHPRCVQLYEDYLSAGVSRAQAEAAGQLVRDMRLGAASPVGTEVARRTGGLAEETLRQKFRRLEVRSQAQSFLASLRGDNGFPQRRLPRELSPSSVIVRRLRARESAKYLRAHVVDTPPTESYALFLLHVSPEWSVDVIGWPFRDQVFLAHRIAEALPFGSTLAVKEHVSMTGARDPKVYRALLDRPNVCLLPPKAPSMPYIANAKCVCTIAGTAALESMIVGVPAVVFSRAFHSNFSGISHCIDLFALPDLIRDIWNTPARYKANEDEVHAAVAAMQEASVPGLLPRKTIPESMAEDNISLVVRGFVQELRQYLGERGASQRLDV